MALRQFCNVAAIFERHIPSKSTLVDKISLIRSISSQWTPSAFSVPRNTVSITASQPALPLNLGSIMNWARFASTSNKLKPRFQGGKMKPYSAFKDRFKMTANGKIRYMRPGHVHKRFSKGQRQLQELAQTKIVHDTYAKTMRKLGFVMRRF